MAGFLGLGGSSGESFFLEPDDAKTMGDIDYMRTPKKVKRTFAKTKGWGDVGASEKTVSAYDERGGEAAGSASTPSYTPSTPSYYTAPATPSYSAPATPTYTPPAAATPAPTPAPQAEAAPAEEAAPAPAPAPSSSGDGMDMFRAMARKIR